MWSPTMIIKICAECEDISEDSSHPDIFCDNLIVFKKCKIFEGCDKFCLVDGKKYLFSMIWGDKNLYKEITIFSSKRCFILNKLLNDDTYFYFREA